MKPPQTFPPDPAVSASGAARAVAAGVHEALSARWGRVYEIAMRSPRTFASGLALDSDAVLRKFIAYGASVRGSMRSLGVFAGFGGEDDPTTAAALHLVESIESEPAFFRDLTVIVYPNLGAGLTALAGRAPASIEGAWTREHPLAAALADEVCAHAMHVVIRLAVDPRLESIVGVVGGARPEDMAAVVGRSSVFPVEWAGRPAGSRAGPLAIAGELPHPLLDIVLRLPADWPHALVDAALVWVLPRLASAYNLVCAPAGSTAGS